VMPDKKTQHMKTRVFKFIALSLYGHQYTPGHRASSLPTRCWRPRLLSLQKAIV